MTLDSGKVYSLIKPIRIGPFRSFAKRCLGLTEGDIEEAEYKERDYVHEQKYHLIHTWHLKNRHVNTADRLQRLLAEGLQDGPIPQQQNELAPLSSDQNCSTYESSCHSPAQSINESGARGQTTSAPVNSRNITDKAASNEMVNHQRRSQPGINVENRQVMRAIGGEDSSSPERTTDGHSPPNSDDRVSESHENRGPAIEQQEETSNGFVDNSSAESEEKNSAENIPPQASSHRDVTRMSEKDSRVSDSPQNIVEESDEIQKTKQTVNNFMHGQQQTEDIVSERIPAACESVNTKAQAFQQSVKTFSDENLASYHKQTAETNLCHEVVQYMEVDSCPDEIFEQMTSNPDYYPVMDKSQKGYILIFNNTFRNVKGQKLRRGSMKDVKNLKKMWKDIGGCKVTEKTDLGADKMLKVLKDFVTSKKRANCGFVCFFIMSHGSCDYYMDENDKLRLGEGYFLGNDGQKIRTADITRMLENTFPGTTLQNTPKLVFFQVCRGDKLDSGIEQSCKATCKAVVETDSVTKLPTISDTLIAHATQSGYKSLRDPESGSWFINAIVNAFSRYAKDEHVADLMTKVNEAVSQQSGELETGESCMEMSTFKSDLRKKLYFYPGQESDGF